MRKKLIILGFFICCTTTISYGQNRVSGYVNIKKSNTWEQKVYLSKINLDEHSNKHSTTALAATPIQENGFFTFDQSVFDTKNHIYKIHLNPIATNEKKILSDKIENFKVFILSKNDTIYFEKGNTLFSNYRTTNDAGQELQKLKKFEDRYENLTADFDPKQYLIETKGYVKDSLQILLVKLIGIKRLDDQNLLEKDVITNPDYYHSFLKELKSSDINPQFYIYLENRLISISQQLTYRKYNVSLGFNGIAFLLVITLCFFYIRSLKKTRASVITPLSKQEKIIKDLITAGKSNKEIANELFISLSTVKTHITNIYGKLNISNRQELL